MKNKKIQILNLIIMAIILSFASCDLLEEDDSVSISERIEAFEDDVNSGVATDITDNFHSEMVSNSQSDWDGVYEFGLLSSDNVLFDFETPTLDSQDGNGVIIASGYYSNNVGEIGEVGSITYSFEMKEESLGDGIWMILSITLNESIVLEGQSLK